MKAVKSVQFGYEATEATNQLLETFRAMVNHAIQICIDEKIVGRFKLRDRIYREFRDKYEVLSHYPYSVAEVAWSIVKKHTKWGRRLLASRLMMKLDRESYSINYSLLRIQYKKGSMLIIPLKYGEYQRSYLTDAALRQGSITITPNKVIVAFSKNTEIVEPVKKMGVDINEKSVVLSDGTKFDISRIARLHTEYQTRRSGFFSLHQGDRRLKRKFSKASREKERVKQALNEVSKEVVGKARASNSAIVMERLTNFRDRHWSRGKSRAFRRRISRWPFRMLQTQINAKASWDGVSVDFVDPAFTSKMCSNCGILNRSLRAEKDWQCPACGCQHDRDVNAAVNIASRSKLGCLAVVRPGAGGA